MTEGGMESVISRSELAGEKSAMADEEEGQIEDGIEKEGSGSHQRSASPIKQKAPKEPETNI